MAYATDVFWKVDLAKLFSIPVRAPVPVDQRGEARPAVGRQCRPDNVLDAQIERQEGLGGDGRGGCCVDGARGPGQRRPPDLLETLRARPLSATPSSGSVPSLEEPEDRKRGVEGKRGEVRVE